MVCLLPLFACNRWSRQCSQTCHVSPPRSRAAFNLPPPPTNTTTGHAVAGTTLTRRLCTAACWTACHRCLQRAMLLPSSGWCCFDEACTARSGKDAARFAACPAHPWVNLELGLLMQFPSHPLLPAPGGGGQPGDGADGCGRRPRPAGGRLAARLRPCQAPPAVGLGRVWGVGALSRVVQEDHIAW